MSDHLQQTGLRQTGRTTRMLKAAEAAAIAGRAVYVIIDEGQQAYVLDLLRKLEIRERLIHFETLKSLPHYNLDTGELRGAHPNCLVLVDHHVIERRYWHALEELHRYDACVAAQ